MENLIPVGLFILCLAGAVALLALAYFLYILVKIIRNTVNEKVNPMLDDAADLIKQAKPIVGASIRSWIASRSRSMERICRSCASIRSWKM